MNWKAMIPASAATLMTPVLAFAHQGHGTFTGIELAHYLTSPAHLAPTLILVAMGVWIWREYRKVGTENE